MRTPSVQQTAEQIAASDQPDLLIVDRRCKLGARTEWGRLFV
jgi:hypothetical protein